MLRAVMAIGKIIYDIRKDIRNEANHHAEINACIISHK